LIFSGEGEFSKPALCPSFFADLPALIPWHASSVALSKKKILVVLNQNNLKKKNLEIFFGVEKEKKKNLIITKLSNPILLHKLLSNISNPVF